MASPIDTVNQRVSNTLKFNNAELPATYIVHSIDVIKAVNKIAIARVAIAAGDPVKEEFTENEETMFQPGKDVEIKLGYDGTNTTVFKGIVEKIEIKLEKGFMSSRMKSLMILNCVDKAVELKNTFTTDIYEKKKDSEIITTLIAKAGLTKTITASKVTHPFFPKYNINDWDFILQRAKANSMIVVNSDNAVKVKSPTGTGAPSLEIKNGAGTISFNAKLSAHKQFQGLTYYSYDPFGEKSANKKAAEPTLTAQGTLKASQLASFVSPTTNELKLPQPLETTELTEIANAELQFARLNRIYGDVKIKGVQSVALDQLVKLTGFGKPFDGSCYVTKVRHEIKNGAFSTLIGFGLEDIDLMDRHIDLEQVVPPVSGLHIAKVKNIDKDPDNEFRIQVVIPAFKETGDGIWARMTHFYTGGASSGAFFIPELNSQVIVSFLGNDPRFPVVLGGLYTKANKPKETAIKKDNFVKEIRTKGDLKITFDDKDKVISISTEKDKQIIKIDDKKKEIHIEDLNGNEITTSSKGITMKSDKEISIEGKTVKINGKSGVTIDGKSGSGVKVSGSNVELKASAKFTAKGGSGADLQASGTVNIKGAAVNIN